MDNRRSRLQVTKQLSSSFGFMPDSSRQKEQPRLPLRVLLDREQQRCMAGQKPAIGESM